MSVDPGSPGRIAIFGSSSQVGSSVAFYLKKYTDLIPVCFIRSVYSKPFFDLLGIETVLIEKETVAILAEKLNQFQMVLDFTFPSGQSFELSQKIREHTERIMSTMHPEAKYVYMSSIMAFGMPDDYGKVKSYFFPRGIYGSIKRRAEKYVKECGKRFQIEVYIFRLGQVHGFLQSVNASFRQQMRSYPEILLRGNSQDLTNTLFIGSLGDAVIQCLHNQKKSGCYSLVSNPQWTLEQLYQYYLKYYSKKNPLIFIPERHKRLATTIKGKGILLLKKMRPLLEIYFLLHFRHLSIRIKGRYRIMEAQNRDVVWKKTFADYHILGQCPSPFFEEKTASPEDMLRLEKEMEKYYSSALHDATHAS